MRRNLDDELPGVGGMAVTQRFCLVAGTNGLVLSLDPLTGIYAAVGNSLTAGCLGRRRRPTDILILGTRDGHVRWYPRSRDVAGRDGHLRQGGNGARTVAQVKIVPFVERCLSCGKEGRLCSWKLMSRRQVVQLRSDQALCLDVSADGKYACAAFGSVLSLVKLKTGQHEVVGCHRNRVFAVRFIEESTYLVSGGDDDLLMVWDYINNSGCDRQGELTTRAIRGRILYTSAYTRPCAPSCATGSRLRHRPGRLRPRGGAHPGRRLLGGDRRPARPGSPATAVGPGPGVRGARGARPGAPRTPGPGPTAVAGLPGRAGRRSPPRSRRPG